ncbi:glycosyl hydrolase 53 family protein [Paenibacillus sp. FSL R10-2736]|uniref:glycosyl hydrolase 53 family protein n=1 Tax=Paenibacillus sp. FSL R10-2736 TaxID=2954692 RepID=UPI0030F71FC8
MRISKKVVVIILTWAMILSVVSVGLPANVNASSVSGGFSKGADISWLPQMEALGYKFYNDNGQEEDLLQILKEHGIDSIRIRAWVNPSDDPASGHNSTQEVVALASRVSAYGFRVMIDLHYSDSWADPGQQVTPQAWKDDNIEQLKAHVSQYTTEVMQALKDANVTPEWVQIGNEINNGMLHPLGSYSNTTNLVQLIQAGSHAAKAVFPDIKVIIHRASGAEAGVGPFFAGLTAAGLKDTDYDIIGLSYYPDAIFTSTLNDLSNNMNALEAKYGKEVMIVEVGGNVSEDVDSVYNMLVAVQNKLKAVPDNRGTGIFYWEPTGVLFGYPLSAWNIDGTPTLAMDAFIDGAAEINRHPVTAVSLDKPVTAIEVGGTDKLTAIFDPLNATYKGVSFTSSKPEVVKVDPYSGILSGVSVGSATVTAVTYDGGFSAFSEVTVIPSSNLIQNPGFEDELNAWELSGDTSAVNIEKDAHSGSSALHYYSATPAEFRTSQTITGLENGTYTLSAWVSGGGGEEISEIFAGSRTQQFTNTGWQKWSKPVLDLIEVTDGTLTLGAHLKLADGQWGNIDDFELIKKDTSKLLDLRVNGATVSGFDPTVQDYSVVLPYGTTVLPAVEAVAEQGISAEITQTAALPGSATVVVKGEVVRTYTLHFTVDLNPVVNSGFEQVNEAGLPDGWTIPDPAALTASSDGRTGARSLGFWKDSAFTLDAYQTLTALENGIYMLTAWSQGAGDETKNQLYALNGEKTLLSSSFANKGWNVWNQAVVENIKVTDGTLKIGISLEGNAKDWGSYDDIVLVKTGDTPVEPTPTPTLTPTSSPTAIPTVTPIPTPNPTASSEDNGLTSTGGVSTATSTPAPIPAAVISGTAADGSTTYSVKIKATAGKEAGAAIVKLDSTIISDLVGKVKQAVAAGQKVVMEIQMNPETGQSSVDVVIATDALKQLMEAAGAELKLNTGIADITFTSKAVAAIGSAAADSTISIKKLASSSLPDKARSKLGDRPVVDFSVTAGNAEITAFNGETVKISVPYTPKATEKSNAIVVYYIDQTGNLQLVNGGYDAAAGKVNFQTAHFSNYAVGYNEIKFNDVAPGNWYSSAVDYLAAREVVKGVSSSVFAPEAQVKRADFLMMVMNAFGIKPDADSADNFTDAGNKYYTSYLGTAKKLGLISGVGGNSFMPEAVISRQEASVILYNIMKQLNRLPDGSNVQSYDSFTDVSAVAGYAQTAMKQFVEAGILTGLGKELSPGAAATRAEAAQIIYNCIK